MNACVSFVSRHFKVANRARLNLHDCNCALRAAISLLECKDRMRHRLPNWRAAEMDRLRARQGASAMVSRPNWARSPTGQMWRRTRQKMMKQQSWCPRGVHWPPRSRLGRADAARLACAFETRNGEQTHRPVRLKRCLVSTTRAASVMEAEAVESGEHGHQCCARRKSQTMPTAQCARTARMKRMWLEWC
jgi:hypothetical protein